MDFEKDEPKSKLTIVLILMVVRSDVTVGIGFIAIEINNASANLIF